MLSRSNCEFDMITAEGLAAKYLAIPFARKFSANESTPEWRFFNEFNQEVINNYGALQLIMFVTDMSRRTVEPKERRERATNRSQGHFGSCIFS